MGDDSELREVLVNMVFNAIDAMPEGGTLSLDDAYCGESVIVKVVDTGVGCIPKFVRRSSIRSSRRKAKPGSGWACSQFRNHQAHGGNIEVESQYGKGLSFASRCRLRRSARRCWQRRGVERLRQLLYTAPPLVQSGESRGRDARG
jgi:signal transduction histidine kinase